MRDLSASRERPVATARTVADILDEFRRPGRPLHGLAQADAERLFLEVVEQLLLNAVCERQDRRMDN